MSGNLYPNGERHLHLDIPKHDHILGCIAREINEFNQKVLDPA